MFRPSRDISAPGSRYASWALALLFSTVAINVLDRQIINILAENIKTDLRISDAQLGLLTGTAFGIFYSVLGIPLGRLADKVDRIRLIGAALVVWSAFTALSGLARNFVELGLARTGVGVGEAGCMPASIALVSDLYPENRRASAISWMMLGAPAGTIAGLLFGGLAGEYLGWRTALFMAGIPGILLAIVLVATVRDPRSHVLPTQSIPTGATMREASFLGAAKTLLRQPGYVLLVVGMTCSIFLAAVCGAWLPVFFMRTHSMTVAQIGGFAALSVGVGGGIGTLGVGLLCDALRRHVQEVESKLLVAILVISVPALLVTIFSTDRFVALASMLVLNICVFAYLSPTALLVQKAVTADTRSLALAGGISVANILSLGLGIPLVGALSDALTPYFGTRAIGYALSICVVVSMIGAIAHWRAGIALRRRI